MGDCTWLRNSGYRDFLKDRAVEHAMAEWERFKKMLADGSQMRIG